MRTTTNVAGASVVGIDRDTRRACPLPTPPDKATGARSLNGVADVPNDPHRIIALDTAALDAVCALGLWERVVGATLPGPSWVGGALKQPSYLGTGIAKATPVGSVGRPDTVAIQGLHPDLILGADGDGNISGLSTIAPTLLVDAGTTWQDQFSAFATALGRTTAATKTLADYRTYARNTGLSVGSAYSQASLLRFTRNDIQVLGDDTFAAGVLADAGVQRPMSQRGRTYTVTSLAADADRAKVEGDIIYVMFDSTDGKHHAESVMHGADWRKLSAVDDRREFAVDDTIWHGRGLTAARAILDDLHKTLNGYVTD